MFSQKEQPSRSSAFILCCVVLQAFCSYRFHRWDLAECLSFRFFVFFFMFRSQKLWYFDIHRILLGVDSSARLIERFGFLGSIEIAFINFNFSFHSSVFSQILMDFDIKYFLWQVLYLFFWLALVDESAFQLFLGID